MRIPGATYRVQLHAGFRFQDARALIPYLDELGVTDFYASPVFKAKPGSTSGYDITDPEQLNPELGSQEEFRAFADELKRRGMGLLIDIVPNHMAADSGNKWWMDVLENGPCSPFANYFDIDWDPAVRVREDRILRPILGAPFGVALENQELRVAFEEGSFFVYYYQHKMPVDPATYGAILHWGTGDQPGGLGLRALQELNQLNDLVAGLPPRTTTDPEKIDQRYRETEILKHRLLQLSRDNPDVIAFLDQRLQKLNGVKGDPRSFDALEDFLAQQPYTLSYWRVAREKINYRRFFDIAELIGVRVELPEVFEAIHSLVFGLVHEGFVTGLRIDHIDGMYDPAGYLGSLRYRVPDSYLVVEKILRGEEKLPEDWPVEGTTGYEFANAVNAVLLDPEGLKRLDASYRRFTGNECSFEDMLYAQKKRIISQLFAGEALSLGLQLGILAEQDRHARDLSPRELQQALIEVTACLPIYRTYILAPEMSTADRAYIEAAVRQALRRNPPALHPVLEFLRHVLLLEFPPTLPPGGRPAWKQFVRRWQQFTGPAMAKGLEDTTFYIDNRLISMNEVGGPMEPLTPEKFHQFNLTRLGRSPSTLNTTSTHDTKRSEDVRARITVLSELPDVWSARISRWGNLNAGARLKWKDSFVPGRNEETFLYQTLVGAWPLDPAEVPSFQERLQNYLVKGFREAKVNTSWTTPDEGYEQAVAHFVKAILEPSDKNRFLPDFLSFQARIAAYGSLQSLSQTLLRLTAPGVPDTYQGTELWDFSLVDPDNRRPVDFILRHQLLQQVNARPLPDLIDKWKDGGIKLYLIQKVLQYRKAHPDLFLAGDYLPCYASGPKSKHVLAFARCRSSQWVLAIVPRLTIGLTPAGSPPALTGRVWRDTELSMPEQAPRRWTNILTGEHLNLSDVNTVQVRSVLQRFPVALLAAGGGAE
jgi:(1->4)-alpha-D-glucan 1-alpha-D-glucosylmutase